jgi:hypothetical protein
VSNILACLISIGIGAAIGVSAMNIAYAQKQIRCFDALGKAVQAMHMWEDNSNRFEAVAETNLQTAKGALDLLQGRR